MNLENFLKVRLEEYSVLLPSFRGQGCNTELLDSFITTDSDVYVRITNEMHTFYH